MASDKDTDLLNTALERFKVSAEATLPQRQRELEDLKFIDFDEQWPEDVKGERLGQQANAGLTPLPPKPCMTINKLRQPVQQLDASQRAANLALQFIPKGDGASQETAKIFEDIVRAIQADSRANLARNWAYRRAVKCGTGAYRILTRYVHDQSFDQEIYYQRILNQSAVYFDPHAQEPDWSDGEWCLITEDLPLREYKRQYGASAMAAMTDDELTSLGNDQPGWVNQASGPDAVTVRIAEYYYFEHTKQTLHLISTPQGPMPATDDQLAALPDSQAVVVLQTREVDARQLKWAKINCAEVLEQQDCDGAYIPVVPVIGDESNVNGERRWVGIVRPAMDAQRSYNVMRSAQALAIGLAPLAPYVGYAEQFEGFEDKWREANTRAYAYLPVNKATDATGAALPLPKRNVEEPAIQAITLAAHEANEDITATTGVPPVALGQLDPHDRSGQAIRALQQVSDQGISGFLDNLTAMSMVYEGKILRDLIPKVYDRPGRIVAAIGADDSRTLVMLQVPHVTRNGQPVPAPPGMPGAKVVNLAQGAYTVAIKVGKAYATQRQERADLMGQLAQAAPQLVPAYADLWVGSLDGPGMTQIADRLHQMLPPALQQSGDQNDPMVLQQKLMALGQQHDQLVQVVQKQSQMLQTQAVKAQFSAQENQQDNAVKLEIARENNATAFQIANLKGDVESARTAIQSLQLELAALKHVQGQVQAASEQGRQHAHDLRSARHDHAHELALAQQAHQHALAQAAQEHQQTLAQQQQAADLAPEPTPGNGGGQ